MKGRPMAIGTAKLSGSTTRKLALGGAASLCALTISMISPPAVAQAAEREPVPGVCDVPERGVMYCGKEDEPFTDGITFFYPADLTIRLDDGLNVAPNDGALGIF